LKALQVQKPHEMKLIEQNEPGSPGRGEVLVKIKRMGICGSDMHILHGENPFAKYPRIIGHEIAGEIVSTGDHVSGLNPEDKVVIEPISSCGECYACKNGRPNVCTELKVMGVHVEGGAQEFIKVPLTQVHKVRDDLSWAEIVLVEPFTIGAQAVYRGEVQENDVVFVMGAGPIGLCCLQMAKLYGAKVIISDINKDKLKFAEESGADFVINVGETDAEEEIRKYTDGMGANVVIDAVGTPKTFEQAVQIASAAGRVVLLGFNANPSSIAQLEITKKELNVCGSRLQTHRFQYVVDLFNERKLDLSGFVTHEYPVDKVEEAIELIERAEPDTRKVLLQF
jgi:2-desacetyl-2-hydroxyethyl bacteriochlorophyllide A dehydrogenase